jgi:hypothetical protein
MTFTVDEPLTATEIGSIEVSDDASKSAWEKRHRYD